MGLRFSGSKRKGLTLVELIVVLIIVAIVTIGFGTSANRNIKKTNRETVVNELQVLASNFSDAYYDLGNPAYDPSNPDDLVRFRTFLQMVCSDYIGYSLDLNNITPTPNGFKVKVLDPIDVWEQNYMMWFVTKEGGARYVIVASGGDDGIISESGYASQNYSDDIVMVTRPKISE